VTVEPLSSGSRRYRRGFALLCVGGLCILPMGALAIASQAADFEIPKSLDGILAPALIVLLLVGVAAIAVGAKMMRQPPPP
jgi:hypothetical protein